MNTNLVKEVANTQLRTDVPFFKAGDTVKVMVRIVENGKTRSELLKTEKQDYKLLKAS